ncbi:MAG: SIR2 family protein [Nitrospirota bacterium]
MTTGRDRDMFEEIAAGLVEGTIIPYLGPGVFQTQAGVPVGPSELADWLCHKIAVPGRIRGNLTAVAQYIENFKHRKTLTHLMNEAFTPETVPAPAHRLLSALPRLRLVVDTWYDGTTALALMGSGEQGRTVCQITGVSRSEHPNDWVRYAGGGASIEAADTVLYKPHGSVYPEPNFLVSDADYVEVLTEIDIQTPIPPVVQRLRTGSHFLFLGCRFNQQLDRIFARQIMKRSSDRHWAVLDGELSKKEAQFLAVQGILPIRKELQEFIGELAGRWPVVSHTGGETVSCKSV